MKTSGNHIKKYNAEKGEWENASGNALDGSGLFGADAQRKMIVEALNGAINSCEELKSLEYDFFYACCPGYPEVDVALRDLNKAKREMFYIVTDTPKTLKPTVRAITDWGKGGNGSHGLEGRTLRSMYMTRQYPPMGMSSNVDGTLVAIPTSICKMKNLLNLPTGQICAGSQYGVISNIGSTGYITDENEYAIVSVFFSSLGSIIGTIVIQGFFKKSRRQSYLVFALFFVIGISAIILPISSIVSTIHDFEKGVNVFTFNDLCS
jgi:hypothetical protein